VVLCVGGVVDGAHASAAADGAELAAEGRAHGRLSARLWYAHQVAETPPVQTQSDRSAVVRSNAVLHGVVVVCCAAVAGPSVWNSLRDFIQDPTISADCFRRLLKTYLFARY